MAQVIAHKCISCGAPLKNARGGKYTCPFCGTINFLEIEKKTGDEITCPDCGAVNPKDALHCSACGLKFTIICPRCGQINQTGVDYCTKCGVNIKDEALRIKNAEAQRALQRTFENQKRAKKSKKTAATLGIIFVVLFCLVMVIVYQANFSAKAHTRQTATQQQMVLLTQSALADLSVQYPYHFTSDDVNIYVTQVCYLWNASHNQWVLSVKYESHNTWLNDPGYKHSYLIDNFDTRYEAAYSDDSFGSGKIQFQAFNKDATRAILSFAVSSSADVTYPVEIDLADPRLQVGCAK